MVTTDGTGLKDLGFRQYDPATGRFDAVDPLAELQLDNSTYQYAGNNPVSQIDVLGLDPDDKKKFRLKTGFSMYNARKAEKQQRKTERRNERAQASAQRKEAREQKRDEHAKNKENKGSENTSAKADANNSESSSNDLHVADFADIHVDGPLYPGSKKDKDPLTVVNSINNGSTDKAFNNFSDNVVGQEINNTSSTMPISVIRSYEFARKNPDVERTRQYLYSHHPINEARALYQRMLIGRSDNTLSTSLKQADDVRTSTSTSEDVFAPTQDDKINCPTCPSGWEALIKFKPPQSSYEVLKELNDYLPVNEWYILNIEDAYGSKINLDEYPVKITDLPDGMTDESLIKHVREHLNDFLDQSVATFREYSLYDKNKWASSDPLNSIMVFDIGGNVNNPFVNIDDAAVLATSVTATSWIFSTISSPDDGEHPVSGIRMFAILDNGDGTFTFYTKGADVLTGWLDEQLGDPDAFIEADKLWESFRDKLIEFIEEHGGQASKESKQWNQYQLVK